MAMVNAQAPHVVLQDDAEMKDPVPEAVAGFISAFGVDLTEDQKAQLQVMLKRPQEELVEEAKRRKTDPAAPTQSCG